MKVIVIGGSGLIGSKVVIKLARLNHDVIIASPSTGTNTITGEGLAKVLKGADKVVDVSNSASLKDSEVIEFFRVSGENIMREEKIAGIKHHIALSIVGLDRLLDIGLVKAKQVQEQIIKESKQPYTILHSTQFFEFAGGIVNAGTIGEDVHLSTSLFQPIASDEVVDALIDVILADPINGVVEVGGPEKMAMDHFAKLYMHLKEDRREIFSYKNALYFGSRITDESLIPHVNSRKGSIRYEEWLKDQEVISEVSF